MKSSLGSVMAALAAIGTATAARGQDRIVYVDQTAPSGGDGRSWQRAFRQLDVALAAIGSQRLDLGVEVRVAQGTYRPTLGNTNDSAFDLDAYSQLASSWTFSIQGSFAGLRGANPDDRDYVATPTILSGDVLGDDEPGFGRREDNRGPVLRSRSGSPAVVLIDGVRVTGGKARFWTAGGIELAYLGRGRASEITNCVIEECEGFDGGGLYAGPTWGPGLVVSRCIFRNNSASQHGGACYTDGPVFIERSSFVGNQAGDFGGAVAAQVWSGVCGVWLCVLAGNRAVSGGALHGGLDVGNCLITSNSAVVGGGCFLSRGSVASSTIVHNRAAHGGGMHLSLHAQSVANSIIALNHAASAGAQLSHSDSFRSGFVLQSVLIAGGRAGIYGPFGGPITPDSRVLDVDPRFMDANGPDGDPNTWMDNDYHLRRNSLAIDAGSETLWNAGGLDLDENQRRLPRLAGGPTRLDLGCYEHASVCPADSDEDLGVTIDDLIDFIATFTIGAPDADLDDGSRTFTPDGGVTIDDLLYFLDRYNAGC